MKHFLFVGSLFPGGTQNYLLRFVYFLKNNTSSSDEVYIVCKFNRTGELEKSFKDLGVKIILLKLDSFNFLNYIKLFFIIKNKKPHSVCDFTGNFSAIVLIVSKICKVKNRIVFYRGATNRFESNNLKNMINKFLNIIVLSFSTKILFNSIAAQHYYTPKNLHNNKSKVIYNGVSFIKKNKDSKMNELFTTLRQREKSYIIGHTGRYNKTKNHECLIEVAIKTCNLNDDCVFVFCGSNVKDKLSKRVEQENLENRIYLFNYIEDVEFFLQNIDLFIFPSKTEGQPNSLIEAMYLGVPVIASNIEPIKESTPNFIHKFLFDYTDIDSIIDLILNIKNENIVYPREKMKTYCQEMYNPNSLFSTFYKELSS